MMRRALLLLLAVPVAGCTANASAEYAELAIGRADPVPDTRCVPLPLLPGAKIIEDLSLGAGISAQVLATPDAIDITLGGTTTAEHRLLSHDQVYDQYAERILVTTPDGASHTVILVSPCDAD
jgi:hypothetical protein